ncbi:MAG: long-chain fatty acid--CoA ligase [Spirochaetaceae bacterium]|nr:MAG: long-chain fatty acid--CoA ligase [Spirochaetaceae bacterium]
MSDTSVRTIPDILETASQTWPDQPALSFVDGTPLSFGATEDLSARVGAGLMQKGLNTDSHVAILSENMPHWGVAYFAITRIGAAVVPILPDFSAHEVKNILEHAEVKTVFVSERQRPKITDLIDAGKIIAIPIETLEGVISDQRADRMAIDEGDLAAIIYTSGTTGTSKGVMLTHRNIVSNVLVARTIPAIEAGQSMLSVLPLSHTYECTLGFLVPISSGACVYYLSKPPSPTVLMPALDKIRPHLMLSVPLFIEKIFRNRVLPQITGKALLRMLYRIRPVQKLLHRAAGRKVYAMFGGRLHFFGVGGAKLAPDVERFLRDARFPYAIGYGLTETSPLVAGSAPQDTTFQAIGPVVDGVSVRLSEEGEVQVKGPNVMAGYFRNETQTSEVFTADGWFRTGDIGTLSKDGVLALRGRIKNMILGPSGENIYPEQIEAVINEKDYVEESLVMQVSGKLVGKVYLNYEALLDHIAAVRSDVKDWHAAVGAQAKDQSEQIKLAVDAFRDDVNQYLKDCRERVNSELSSYARIAEMVLQMEPFEKTPTMKIKRYLYTE